VLERACREAGIWGADQNLQFPLIVKSGVNEAGKIVRYYFNYSDEPKSFVYPYGNGIELLKEREIRSGGSIELERWGIGIVEEQ
jgi:beta-galactosidase